MRTPARHLILALATACVVASSSTSALAARAGDPDPSFGTAGRVVVREITTAHDTLVQPDGKVLIAGEGPGDADFVVARLNADGSPDRSFGSNGIAATDFGGRDSAYSLALQADGAIVVAGEMQTPTAQAGAIARFDRNGHLDATFDPGGADGDGRKLISAPYEVQAVFAESDGGILVTGPAARAPGNEAVAVRLTATGTLAKEFEHADFGAVFEPAAGAIMADGGLVIAGVRFEGGAATHVGVARYTPQGTLDPAWGDKGEATAPLGDLRMLAQVLAMPDGKVVVAGTGGQSGVTTSLLRLDRDGAPDPSFGPGGHAPSRFEGQVSTLAAAVAPDGKLVTAGVAIQGFDMSVARVRTDGALDGTFGSDGRADLDFGSIEAPWAVAVQPDGAIVVAGVGVTGAPVARLLPDQARATPPAEAPSAPQRPDPEPSGEPDTPRPLAAASGRVARRFAVRGGKTTVKRLTLSRLTRGATVEVSCKGRGGFRGTSKFTVRRASLKLTSLFKKRKLRARSRIEIRIAQPGRATRVFRYTTQKGKKQPKAVSLTQP